MYLVWPNNNPTEHVVQVKIDYNETVAFLKDLIKDKHHRTLADVEACDLILWKCSIPCGGPELKETLNTIHFGDTDSSLERLEPFKRLSKLFSTSLPDETIHILVQVPALGECGTRISCSPFETRMLHAENNALDRKSVV